jgi:hypothetical protein
MAFVVWKTLLRDQVEGTGLRRPEGTYGTVEEARAAAERLAARHRFQLYRPETGCWIVEGADRATFILSVEEGAWTSEAA